MKKVLFISLIIYTFLLFGCAKDNPTGPDNTYFSVYTVYAVGDSGVIIKSTNNGDDWMILESGVTNSLRCVHFEDQYIGWAGGSGGILIKTTDGGESWLNQTSGTSSTIQSLCFVSPNMGWMAASSIRRTTDGGASWTYQPTSEDFSVPKRTVSFCDNHNGIAAGYNLFHSYSFYTTNGGVSWAAYTLFTSGYINCVVLVAPTLGYGAGQGGRVFKTSTYYGGLCFGYKYSPTNEDLLSVDFFDEEKVVYVGENGAIIITSDGGSSLSQKYCSGIGHLYSVTTSDDGRAWACGALGSIIYTSDFGQTWAEKTTPVSVSLKSIFCIPQ